MHYRWIKYRTLHSSGPSQWMFEEYPVDESGDLDLFLKEEIIPLLVEENCTYSEHWRGIEAHYAEPPIEVLKNKLETIEIQMKVLDLQQERCKSLLTELESRRHPG